MHSDCPGLVSIQKTQLHLSVEVQSAHGANYYHYDTLARSLGWQSASGPGMGGSRTETSHSRQSDMLGCQYGCAQ